MQQVRHKNYIHQTSRKNIVQFYDIRSGFFIRWKINNVVVVGVVMEKCYLKDFKMRLEWKILLLAKHKGLKLRENEV